jgi:signal transduction histidine kinase
MTPDVLAKVNARKYYSGRGTNNEKGSGFGLVLVRDLLARHMGELLISSEPGRGTTFSVRIPADQLVMNPLPAATLTGI